MNALTVDPVSLSFETKETQQNDENTEAHVLVLNKLMPRELMSIEEEERVKQGVRVEGEPGPAGENEDLCVLPLGQMPNDQLTLSFHGVAYVRCLKGVALGFLAEADEETISQAIGANAALLPEPMRDKFSKLFDDAPQIHYSTVLSVFKSEFGRPPTGPDGVFEIFEEEAVASASITQVHKAKLKGGGSRIPVLNLTGSIYWGIFVFILLVLALRPFKVRTGLCSLSHDELMRKSSMARTHSDDVM
ncbi:hypothetical protein FIBSPDRAFT_1053094 [Athelia psychrophila]|uniref:ABC1 atypical kinase-like domain-containing protein n=1 Tax=Athelia psychrophila TaxID=1759441 RepID=A0A167XIR8_9AGAM|nr:hypothetical protein FIBSPDRAFT_1053094 [Fibularhizoctonia sp. CBS 109695]